MARSTRGAFGTSPCRTAVTSNGALQDVAPDGTVTDVTAGYLRASLRAVRACTSPHAPGPHQRRPELPGHDDLPPRQCRHQQPQPSRRHIPLLLPLAAGTLYYRIVRAAVGSVSVR